MDTIEKQEIRDAAILDNDNNYDMIANDVLFEVKTQGVRDVTIIDSATATNYDIVANLKRNRDEYIEETDTLTCSYEVALLKSPAKVATPITQDKDAYIKELQEELHHVKTARLVIKTSLQNDADKLLIEQKEKYVSEAKKTLEKNEAKLINDAKKKQSTETIKDTIKKKKPSKNHKTPSNEKEVTVGIDVVPNVPMVLEHIDDELPHAEVTKYEIEPKSTGPFCEECTTIVREEGKEDEEDIIINITNHQKEFGKEGEFLMMLESGYRIWATATLTHRDCKVFQVEEVLLTYMTENKLTFEMMGYVEKVKKQKKIIDHTTSDVPTLIPCDSLHNTFLCFGQETNAGYANINQFYYGVKCRAECNKYFSNKPTKNICIGM